jgi:hypothetical protein
MTRLFPETDGRASLPRQYGWAGRDLSELPETVMRYVKLSRQ